MARTKRNQWRLIGAFSFGIAVATTASAHLGDLPPDHEKPQAAVEPAVPVDIGVQIKMSPTVLRLLDDPILSDAERQRLAVFHGRWNNLDVNALSQNDRALLALLRFDLDDPLLNDGQTSPILRARAAIWRGDMEQVPPLLNQVDSPEAGALLAEAYDMMGETPRALAVLHHWLRGDADVATMSAADQTAMATMTATLANMEGRPSRDFKAAMAMLGRAHSEADPTYWRAMIAEANLLFEKGSNAASAEAVAEVLSLNAKSGEAWYRLGMLHVAGFNFTEAATCAKQLRDINEQHPLAAQLMAHSFLTQKDPRSAMEVLTPVLQRYPKSRELIALAAAAEALSYNNDASAAWLAQFDQLSPGNPTAYYIVGEYLSLARQYPEAEAALRKAIELRPTWPAPQIELGLLLMQSGDEIGAHLALREATQLDQFNRRAANQLTLINELLSYETIETEHFIIRYRAGIDEVLARDMPDRLEAIYATVTRAFEHQPRNKTLIEVMPDEQWFGVRITGMPWIWTIGACTGDVIAITPPRQGKLQRGPFDWPRVLQHEFVHTVTLDQTANRIPHWFTEACAVSQEPGGRDYATYQLLATKLLSKQLFNLTDMNWAFVRPREPSDRALAYAQAHWMLEYITETWGHKAVLELLSHYRKGTSDVDAFHHVTGQTSDEFFDGFLSWGREQVSRWGFQALPDDKALEQVLMQGAKVTREDLAPLLETYPQLPELLKLAAETRLAAGDIEGGKAFVLRYQVARPVDPWADRVLAQLALSSNRPLDAVAAMHALDDAEQMTSMWARQLYEIYTASGQYEQAAIAIHRAIDREPYLAEYREKAAATHLKVGDLPAAAHAVRAMSIIEPDRAVHQVRLAAIYHRMDDSVNAAKAVQAARTIDPNVPLPEYLMPR